MNSSFGIKKVSNSVKVNNYSRKTTDFMKLLQIQLDEYLIVSTLIIGDVRLVENEVLEIEPEIEHLMKN